MNKLGLITIVFFSLISILITNVYAYDKYDIVKNNMDLWVQGQVNDNIFIFQVNSLIQNKSVIVNEDVSSIDNNDIQIPLWTKNSVVYWINGSISDKEFFDMLNYTLDKKIIRIPEKNLKPSDVADLAIAQIRNNNNHTHASSILSLAHLHDPYQTYDLIQNEVGLDKIGYFDEKNNQIIIKDLQTNETQVAYELKTINDLDMIDNDLVWYHHYLQDDLFNETSNETSNEDVLIQDLLDVILSQSKENTSEKLTDMVFGNIDSSNLDQKQIIKTLKILKQISKIDPDIPAGVLSISGNTLYDQGLEQQKEYYCNIVVEKEFVANPIDFKSSLQNLSNEDQMFSCAFYLTKYDPTSLKLPPSMSKTFYDAILLYNVSLVLNSDNVVPMDGLIASLARVQETDLRRIMSDVRLTMTPITPESVFNIAIGLPDNPKAAIILYDHLLKSNPGDVYAIMEIRDFFSCYDFEYGISLMENYAAASNPGMGNFIEHRTMSQNNYCPTN